MCAFILVSIQRQIKILYRCIVMEISETKNVTLRQTCLREKFRRTNLFQNLIFQNPLASALKYVKIIVKFYFDSMNLF